MTLDDLRARFPHLGFALFAMDPADPVTLEAYGAGGETFQWRGASVADVLAKAFPAPAPRCPSMCLAPGEFSGGRQIKCDGVATTDGVVGGCDEPCSFVMHNPLQKTSSVFD